VRATFAVALTSLTGCAAPAVPPPPPPAAVAVAPAEPARAALASTSEAEPLPLAQARAHAHGHHPAGAGPVVIVSDPEVLGRLDAAGFDLGSLWLARPGATTGALAQAPAYRALVAAVRAELERGRTRDPGAGPGMRRSHRQLDIDYLTRPQARFRLIAVVNRLDREPFAPAHCGETRFIYRLEYAVDTAGGRLESRLPVTLNLVEFQGRGPEGCAITARRWLRGGGSAAPDAELAWLTSETGPLGAPARAASTPKSLELNFQSVRWPSTVRPSMAGHAEYGLFAFARLAERPYLVPLPLENQIDAARLSRQPAQRAELLAWLRRPEALAALDAGTLQVPETFLARRALSVAPHGLARRANRPFAQLFEPGDFAGLALDGYTTLHSAPALLRKLDALSCTGCHQGRSLAGFHMLGVEAATDFVDALAVPMSPHLHEDLDRRARYVLDAAHGRVSAEPRLSGERASDRAGRGAHCGLGDPGFASWTCAQGLQCVAVGDAEVGACRAAAAPAVGDPCERGHVTPNPDAHRDRMTLEAAEGCGGVGVCEHNGVGFPAGSCAGPCSGLDQDAVCGGIALLREFNACIASATSFERCLADHTRPGALQACDPLRPCRDDYVCTRLAGKPPDTGACIPPYFLFQLRVDGHPS
jgi:hypothetical protein